MAFVSLFRRQIRNEFRERTPRLELPRRSAAHRATLRRCRTTGLIGTGHAPETMQWRLATRGIATVGLLNSHSRHPLWLRAARAWRPVIRLLDARSDDPSAVQTFLACPTLEERLNGPSRPRLYSQLTAPSGSRRLIRGSGVPVSGDFASTMSPRIGASRPSSSCCSARGTSNSPTVNTKSSTRGRTLRR